MPTPQDMYKVKRANNIKDVIHIKVKKYAGYFNPESKSFAVDPHLTTFEDLQKILVEAFNLDGPFHVTYLCRDDAGDNVFLSMLTDWDLDAAFMTSSDPHLRLKLDAEPYKDGLLSKINSHELPESPSLFPNVGLVKNILEPLSNSANNMLSLQNAQKPWMSSLGSAFSKLALGWGNGFNQQTEEQAFFPSKQPLDDVEFRTYLDGNGRMLKPEELRLRVYHGGIAPALRKVVWRMLLNIFPAHLTGEERLSYMKRKTVDYEKLRTTWQDRADDEHVQRISNMVWKDVLRTDRSHPFYQGRDDNPHTTSLLNILTTFALTHPRVSYCQGMSDLLSPILFVMNHEAQAYVCFCGAMSRLQENFFRDGAAMSIKFKHLSLLVQHHDPEFYDYLQSLGADNMFFCYRWLLLEMKREFSFDNAITVLEVMWSSLPPSPPDDDLPLEDYSKGPANENLSKPGCSNLHSREAKEPDDTKQETPTAESKPAECGSSVDSSVPGTSYGIITEEEILSLNVKERCNDPNDEISRDSDVTVIDYGVRESGAGFQRSAGRSNEDLDQDSISSRHPVRLPPPEEFGCGNPFLLFVCLSVLLEERDTIIREREEYDDLVMHFDRLVRSHCPKKVLSKAMRLFAEYLRTANTLTL